MNTHNVSTDMDDDIELRELSEFYKANIKNLKIGHLNINSLRHKFQLLAQALNKGMLGILSIQETKLDASFPVSQFSIVGYRCYRKDITSRCGGLILYIRSDLPQRRLIELETDYNTINGRIETLAIEVTLNSEKWLIYSLYKQPKLSNTILVALMDDIINKCLRHSQNIIIVGDLNVDFSNPKHCLK